MRGLREGKDEARSKGEGEVDGPLVAGESRGPRLRSSGLACVWGALLLAQVWVPWIALGASPELPPGARYRNDRVRSRPWSIHVLEVDRAQTNLQWVTTLGNGETIGVGVLSDQIRHASRRQGRPIAGMNGDFFSEHGIYSGDPRGMQVKAGELISAPDGNACFWIDRQGQPQIAEVQSRFQVVWPDGQVFPLGLNEDREHNTAVLFTSAIGSSTGCHGGVEYVLERSGTNLWMPLRPGRNYTARVRSVRNRGDSPLGVDTVVLSIGPDLSRTLKPVPVGGMIRFYTATLPTLSGARMALGGNPILVKDGQPAGARAFKGSARHPRAAIGWNEKTIFLVAVDGRQPHLSIGMTLSDLSAYMVEIGCESALNVDGGGSVEMWVLGRIMNSPCYGRERETGNAIVVVDVDAAGSARAGSAKESER